MNNGNNNNDKANSNNNNDKANSNNNSNRSRIQTRPVGQKETERMNHGLRGYNNNYKPYE